MRHKYSFISIIGCFILVAGLSLSKSNAQPPAVVPNVSMAKGENGYVVSKPLITIGQSLPTTESVNDLNTEDGGVYTPVGVLDGLGAYLLDDYTVRVLANHELLNNRGNEYFVSDGDDGTIGLLGARISHFDIDKESKEIVDSGLAYNLIYDFQGNVADEPSDFLNAFYAPFFCDNSNVETDDDCVASTPDGFSRFCSSILVEAQQFGEGEGLNDRAYFTGEEDGGGFNSDGGAEWVLDPATNSIWHAPDLGRGGWENVTEVCTGNTTDVGIILADDSEPFEFDNDGTEEAAPLYLYIGEKVNESEDFLARNGLRGGTLYVFVPDANLDIDLGNDINSPAEFNTSGSITGKWIAIDNTPGANPGGIANTCPLPASQPSEMFDDFGYPSQCNLWLQAEAVGAFGFSRPEDVATNPDNCSEVVLASTGVDTFVNGADTFGTMYLVDTDFSDLSATLTIIYDGDADPDRSLRSPDNLDWADDGFIYVQEDEAEEESADGEPFFGKGAANKNEASIIRIDPATGDLLRVAEIRRKGFTLDASIAKPNDAVDVDAGNAGEWESSGILDVSDLFGEAPGSLLIFDVQAHGIEDQDQFNPESRIVDNDLVEGGQLLFLTKPSKK